MDTIREERDFSLIGNLQLFYCCATTALLVELQQIAKLHKKQRHSRTRQTETQRERNSRESSPREIQERERESRESCRLLQRD
jgi:hypothetical protein